MSAAAVRASVLVATLVVASAPGGASAHDAGHPAAQAGGMQHGAATVEHCATTALACARAVTPFVAPDGALWLAWSAGGSVRVARADAAGGVDGPGIELAAPGAMLDTGADARPQIVVDRQGRVLVAWSVFKDRNFAAQVWISSSVDGVRFEPPRPLSSDPSSQRFPALLADGRGGVDAFWIDKRTTAANRDRYRQAGAALVHAYSSDGGRTFGPERVVADRTCECCRLALTADAAGNAVVAFRAIFDDAERDHAILTVGHDGTVRGGGRVAEDRWAIAACPHHGPAVAVTADGTQHVAWFTLAKSRPGTFYARSADRGAHFGEPRPVGAPERQAGRPSLLAIGNSLWLAWKEFDGARSRVLFRSSADAGRNWSADAEIASTAGYSDHPLLLRRGDRAYLSWMTRDEGYRLLPIDARAGQYAPARTLDVGGYAALRARYAGQPMVVHLWGLTCEPCRAELPRLAALKRARPEMNLVLIEVEGFPAAAGDDVLREAGLSQAERWRTAEPADERLRREIDPDWMGDTPRTLLIDADGATTRIQGAADPGRVDAWWQSQRRGASGGY